MIFWWSLGFSILFFQIDTITTTSKKDEILIFNAKCLIDQNLQNGQKYRLWWNSQNVTYIDGLTMGQKVQRNRCEYRKRYRVDKKDSYSDRSRVHFTDLRKLNLLMAVPILIEPIFVTAISKICYLIQKYSKLLKKIFLLHLSEFVKYAVEQTED
jgi:hypothetical protein